MFAFHLCLSCEELLSTPLRYTFLLYVYILALFVLDDLLFNLFDVPIGVVDFTDRSKEIAWLLLANASTILAALLKSLNPRLDNLIIAIGLRVTRQAMLRVPVFILKCKNESVQEAR